MVAIRCLIRTPSFGRKARAETQWLWHWVLDHFSIIMGLKPMCRTSWIGQPKRFVTGQCVLLEWVKNCVFAMVQGACGGSRPAKKWFTRLYQRVRSATCLARWTYMTHHRSSPQRRPLKECHSELLWIRRTRLLYGA